MPFGATNVAIPFQPGPVLAGAADFNAYLVDGDLDPTNDILVAIGRNRTRTVTAAAPEPASGVVMLGLTGLTAVFGPAVRKWRRRPR